MHHPSDITFYDELSVSPDATPEEIRDSFRALVRILHPDHQTDPQLKEIAELQMRKLNRIYAILSEPEKRRRYNEVLEEEDFRPAIVLSPNSNVNVRRLMERVSWVAALSVVAITLIWLSSDNPAASSTPIPEHPLKKNAGGTPGTGASMDALAGLQEQMNALKLERDTAVRELTRLRASATRTPSALPPSESVAVVPAPLPTTITELPSQALPPSAILNPLPARVASAKQANTAPRPFAGFWFYVKPATPQRARTSTLYPPEFIETTITEQNGVVKGKYRSRYKVADRAISPDVSFAFSGTANGTTMVCPWTGLGGSKGELTLKMAGENAMLVEWIATDPGSIQGLITGTATLTRRID